MIELAPVTLRFRCDGGDAVWPCHSIGAGHVTRTGAVELPEGWWRSVNAVTAPRHYCEKHHVTRNGVGGART